MLNSLTEGRVSRRVFCSLNPPDAMVQRGAVDIYPYELRTIHED